MNEFFDVAILYACVFLLGVGLPWFFRNPYWDMADPWRKRKKKEKQQRK